MKNISMIIGLVILFTVISCEEIDNENINKIEKNEFVLAGYYDSTYNHILIEPDFYVELKQIGCWEMEGEDSIDIDGNGNFDIILKTGDLNNTPYEDCCPQPEDTNMIIDCYPSFFPYYQINVKDSFEILADTFIYRNINTITYFFIDTLNLNDTINKRENWNLDEIMYFYTYNKPPTNGYGYWINIGSSKYLGFRFSRNGILKYGWIRIEKTDRLIIKEIAYKK